MPKLRGGRHFLLEMATRVLKNKSQAVSKGDYWLEAGRLERQEAARFCFKLPSLLSLDIDISGHIHYRQGSRCHEVASIPGAVPSPRAGIAQTINRQHNVFQPLPDKEA
jgi:hypothetical protein